MGYSIQLGNTYWDGTGKSYGGKWKPHFSDFNSRKDFSSIVRAKTTLSNFIARNEECSECILFCDTDNTVVKDNVKTSVLDKPKYYLVYNANNDKLLYRGIRKRNMLLNVQARYGVSWEDTNDLDLRTENRQLYFEEVSPWN